MQIKTMLLIQTLKLIKEIIKTVYNGEDHREGWYKKQTAIADNLIDGFKIDEGE